MNSKVIGYGLTAVMVFLVMACASTFRPFPNKDPIWRDEEDFRKFSPEPEEFVPATIWNAVHHILLRPLPQFFAVDPAREAENINSMDEVPDSSWFLNRMSRNPMTVEEAAKGACGQKLDPNGPFEILGGKPDGWNPGFLVKASDGNRYFFKFDYHELQPERASFADVIGSLIYYAAGYYAPCNQIVYFKPSALILSKKAKVRNKKGQKVPMTQADVDRAFKLAAPNKEGLVRAAASQFLEGKPIGPWKYDGKRGDDPNDVIRHEDRREIRALYVLAAWINHFDSRDQNTLTTWMSEKDGKGYVRHNIIDFGDSFGNLAAASAISKRLGYSYYLDFDYLAGDFVSLGIIERPWDVVEFGKAGPVLGYYNVKHFEADKWRSGYPNPSFERMQEADGAWMARIVAEFTPEHIQALVDEGRIQNKMVREELTRILIGRRAKILKRYFQKISPIARPNLESRELCVRDLAVYGGVVPQSQRKYSAKIYTHNPNQFVADTALTLKDKKWASLCLSLPANKQDQTYWVIDVTASSPELNHGPARIHIVESKSGGTKIVGLERPEEIGPPF